MLPQNVDEDDASRREHHRPLSKLTFFQRKTKQNKTKGGIGVNTHSDGFELVEIEGNL